MARPISVMILLLCILLNGLLANLDQMNETLDNDQNFGSLVTNLLRSFEEELRRETIRRPRHQDGNLDEALSPTAMQKRLYQHKEQLRRLASLVHEMESEVVEKFEDEQEDPCFMALINSRQMAIMEQSKAELHDLKNRPLMMDTIELKRDVQSLRSITVLGKAEFLRNLDADYVNGLNVSEFFADSLMESDVAFNVQGSKTFTGKVTFKDAVRVLDSLEGIHPDDLVRTDRPQTMRGPVKFLAPVTVRGDVSVRGRVNNVDLSEEAVLMKPDAPQTIEGEKVFVDEVVVRTGMAVKGNIDGLKLSRLAANVVTSPGRQMITGHKTFSKMTVRGDLKARRVNNLDLNRLHRTSVRAETPATIQAPKTFQEDVVVDGDFEAVLNGLHIPQDLVPLVPSSSESVKLQAAKTFAGSLRVDSDLMVKGTLDGVDLIGDTVKTQGDQRVEGVKTFLGPVQVQQLEHDHPSSRIDGSDVVVVVHGDLHVKESINDVRLKDIMFRNETSLAFQGPVTFVQHQDLRAGMVTVNGLVDGFDLRRDFLLKRSMEDDVIVTGTKIFLKPLVIEGDLNVGGSLDGIRLAELKLNIVYLDDQSEGQRQIVFGRKTFADGFSVRGDLGLSHLTMDDLALDGFNVDELTVRRDLMVDGDECRVNGHDLKALYDNRLTLSTDQNIRSRHSISGDWTLENLFVNGLLNGHNVSALWNDVLWKTLPRKQILTGQKTFTGIVNVSRVSTSSQGIDGLSLEDIARRSIPIHDIGILDGGRYVFDGGLTASDIQLHSSSSEEATINGVSLSSVFNNNNNTNNNNAKKSGDEEGFVELHVEGDVTSSSVNGLVLERDALTANTAQKVTGHFELLGNVLASDEVTVGVVRGPGTLRIRGDLAVDVLSTGANLNGVDIRHLRKDAVTMSGQERLGQKIGGTKRLSGSARFKGNLTVVKTINGLDYVKRFEDIVTLSDGPSQVLTGKNTFSGRAEVIHDVHRQGSDAQRRTSRFVNDEVVIPGSLTILGDVTTRANINGIRFSKNVLTNSGHQKIAGHKRIDVVYVDGDVDSQDGQGCILKTPKAAAGNISTNHIKTRRDKVIHFHGKVTFLKGISQQKSPQTSVDHDVLGKCSVVKKCPSILERAAEEKAFESLQLVQRVNCPEVSAVEVASNVLLVGFAGCQKPLQIHRWDPRRRRFALKETAKVFSVEQIKVFPSLNGAMIVAIRHQICSTGANVITLYALTSAEAALETRGTFPDNFKEVDFDATFQNDGHTVLMANLAVRTSTFVVTRFTLARLLGQMEPLVEVDIRAGARNVKTMTIAGKTLVMVGYAAETIFYEVGRGGQVKWHAAVLDGPVIAAWTIDGMTEFLVTPGREVLKVHSIKFDALSGHLSIQQEADKIVFGTDQPLLTANAVATRESSRVILVLLFGHRIALFSKEGASNFVAGPSFAANVKQAESGVVKSNGEQFLLVTRTMSGWNAYASHGTLISQN